MAIEEPVLTDVFGKPETWQNPYPAYREFRARAPFVAQWPIVFLDGAEKLVRVWMLLKYEQVNSALRDPATFSSEQPNAGAVSPKLVMISDDPPRHDLLRKLINKAFTARRISELVPWIKDVAGQLLGDMPMGASVDAVSAFTMPLPVQVIARMLGIPGEAQADFRRWSDALVAFNGGTFTVEERVRNGMEMLDYFRKTAAARREKGGNDLISAIVEAEVDGKRLEEWEVLGFCVLLLVAGNETTTNLMSNMLNILVDRPDLWRRLREDRTLVESAIEETLRYDCPVQMLTRRVTRDVEIDGRAIHAGEQVAVSYGAANRDPAMFPDPDTFLLDRENSRHLGFGAGTHYCLGAPLARMEATIMLNAMLDRFSSLARGDEAPQRQVATNLLFGFRKLPLKFVA
ncbi:MAG TPA: cytochrome P450 [Candidatus Binataceae bacterium]|nr:cytochrome P450 [Candidatus Binataceae bacterium]